jgi:hypothetical protein
MGEAIGKASPDRPGLFRVFTKRRLTECRIAWCEDLPNMPPWFGERSWNKW